ncbi:MAG TPA: hypothetical protein VIX82_05610 [Solirubrobacteraceae bacterium]
MSAFGAIALTAMGLVLLVVAVWARRPALVGWGLAALAGAFAVGLLSTQGAGLGAVTPAVAAAMLMLGEAAFYGAERAAGTEYGARQTAWLTLAALAGLAVSALVLLAARIAAPSSLVLTIGGTLAAVLAIALPSVRFRRFRRM